jgi:hypothetical protein
MCDVDARDEGLSSLGLGCGARNSSSGPVACSIEFLNGASVVLGCDWRCVLLISGACMLHSDCLR